MWKTSRGVKFLRIVRYDVGRIREIEVLKASKPLSTNDCKTPFESMPPALAGMAAGSAAFRNTDPNPAKVAWFEFLLNPVRLEEHLKGSNVRLPVPSGSTLLADFLQHADARDERNEADPTFDTGRLKTAKTLRLLSLKTAALLDWNLNIIENVPLPSQMTLFHEMMAAAQLPPLTFENGTLNVLAVLDSLKPYQLCAVALYHRWCLFTLTNSVIKNAPQKVGLIPPTVTMPPSLMVECNPESVETVLGELEKMAVISCQILGKIAASAAPVSLPSSQCFSNLTRICEDFVEWDKAVPVPVNEARCQDNYDLGVYLFYKEDMDGAKECLDRAVDLYLGLDQSRCTYCTIREPLLRGFALALNIEYDDLKMRRVGKARKRGCVDQFFECMRKKEAQSLAGVLEADVMTREIPPHVRDQLELDFRVIARDWDVNVPAFEQLIMMTNAIRSELADDDCVRWNFVGFLRKKRREDLLPLCTLCAKVLTTGSPGDRRRMKRFVVQLILEGIPMTDLLLFQGTGQMLFSEEETAQILFALNREQELMGKTKTPSISLSKLRGKGGPKNDEIMVVNAMAASFLPANVKELAEFKIFDSTPHFWIERRFVTSICIEPEVKKLPKDVLSSIYARAVFAKIRHLLQMKDYDRARLLVASFIQDLDVALSHKRNYPRTFRQLAEFEALNVEVECILHQMKRDVSVKMSVASDMLIKVRACLSMVMQRAQTSPDIPMPADYLIENGAILLLNLQHWDDWSVRPGLLVSPHDAAKREDIRNCLDIVWLIGRMVAEVTQEKMGKEAFKTAKLVWENCLDMFVVPKENGPPVAPPIMTQSTFKDFFVKLVHPTMLSVLISMLSAMVNALKQDPTSELDVDYEKAWPTARIGNLSNYCPSDAADLLDNCLDHALALHPRNPNWIKTKADVQYGMGHHALALRHYLECCAVHSEFFCGDVAPYVFDDVLLKRMIMCCVQARKFTYAGILCQYLDDVDKYNRAFQCLHDRTCCDASDELYHMIWDVTILEFLVNLHSRRGEELKMQQAMQVMKNLDVNSNNSDVVKEDVIRMKKNQFFRFLVQKYWVD